MARYAVRYSETLSETYVIEADSFEKAKDKLYEAIMESKVSEPMLFDHCDYEDVTSQFNNIENAHIDA